MTLTEARLLRDQIRGIGLRCVVPLGWGPEAYFVRVWVSTKPADFPNREAWEAHGLRPASPTTVAENVAGMPG
jgi:hypothetical protein